MYISEDSKAFKWLILLTGSFVTMLYGMAVFIATIALPDMMGALSSTQDQITWSVTGNIVATAIFTPFAGWISTRYEIRHILLISVVGFILSSFFCGFSNNLEQIVTARFLQGAFAAPLPPLAQTLILGAFPLYQRNLAIAIWGMANISGLVVAPMIGGFLGEILEWRWIFYCLMPFGFIAIALVYFTVPLQNDGQKNRFDWIGFISISICLGSLQIMFDRGERNGWFESNETIFQLGTALLAFYFFISHSLTYKTPFINLKIFKNWNYSLGLILIFFFGMLNFVPMIIFPPLLQELRGYPQSIIGLLIGVRGLGAFVGFALMAFANRLDPKISLSIAFALQGFSGLYMASFNIDMLFSQIAWAGIIQGMGVGMAWVPISVFAFSTIDKKYFGEATAMYHLVRNVASSLFISITVAVVLHTGQLNFGNLSSFVTFWNEGLVLNFANEMLNEFDTITIANLTKEVSRQSLMIGYINSFKLFAIVSFLTIPFLFLIRRQK
ncbi:MAG: MFS transporter [SAR116 cluster bacterium]|nr:MFS transporter [SAR116 cluster bacterium]RPH10099.1 MAG: DHA2 family efflux MFS transporter permease subunit [Alphaproteobacteria bacterium TMED54]